MSKKLKKSRIVNCNFSYEVATNKHRLHFDFNLSKHKNLALINMNGLAILTCEELAELYGPDHENYESLMAQSAAAKAEPEVLYIEALEQGDGNE